MTIPHLNRGILLAGIRKLNQTITRQGATLPVFANSVGVHAGSLTYLADEAIGRRFLIGALGSDSRHIALCDPSDMPLGVITDEAGAAEEPVAVSLLGSASTTLKMVASGAIEAGSLVYVDTGGKVAEPPSSPGEYYCVGRSLTSASGDGDLVEVDPCLPRELTIEL